jgi:hypothetical protein
VAHNLGMLRVIVQYFIRSAWILEGLTQQAGADNQQPRRGENLQRMIGFACEMVKASAAPCLYVVSSDDGFKRVSVHKDDTVSLVLFMMMRLAIDNRGPSHPATYDANLLQSELFSDEIFGSVMDLPLSGAKVDTYNNSRLKNVFVQQLAGFCYSDPAQIPKMIESGKLPRVARMLKQALPVHQLTLQVVFEFVRMIAVHEQGREFLKEHGLFERILMPLVTEDSSSKESDLDLVMQATGSHVPKRAVNVAELLRNNDPYFLETAQRAVVEVIRYTKSKAQFLQERYFSFMAECSRDSGLPKRHFQIDAADMLASFPEYHLVKFELDKLHSLCYSSHFDAAAMQQYIFKVFTADVLDEFLELFEVVSTLRPVYDTQRAGLFQDKAGIFTLFAQMLNILVYEGRNQQYSKGVESFEVRFRGACNRLAEVFADTVSAQEGDKDLAIKYIDLLEILKAGQQRSLPAGAKEHAALRSVAEAGDFRGYLIANVLVVGQYISVFEGTRKSTQEALCVAKEWSRELKILSCFMTAFNECNHKITDLFFQDQPALIQEGVVTQAQIEKISTLFSHRLTSEDRAAFSETRRKIEENIDLHRENLTYMDAEYLNINRLLHVVWEFWRSNRRGHSIDDVIVRNKKAYTALTISNIRDIEKVIVQFEALDGDFHSTQFLTTISRLFTYISELQQLI